MILKSCFFIFLILLNGCASKSAAVKDSSAAKDTDSGRQAASRETKSKAAPEAASTPRLPQPEQRDTAVVKIKIDTSQGDIYADLFPTEAPKTVEHFLQLAKSGYYDGLIFHRVIPGFMIQTGDPTGTGSGGPGYSFADEFSPQLRHDKAGTLSMANSGPNTNGSQFFITEAPTPWLDGLHSLFGQVTEGLEIVKRIARVPRNEWDKPLEPVTMKKVVVLKG